MRRLLTAFVMLPVVAAAANDLPKGKIVLHELAPDRVYTIATPLPHAGVTTVAFPGPIEALVGDDAAAEQTGGSNGAQRVPKETKVFIGHPKGAPWLTIKTVSPEVTNINVVYKNEVYVLMLVPTATPAYLVRFVVDSGPQPQPRLTREDLLTYLDRCKAWELLEEQHPGETFEADHARCSYSTRLGDLELVVTDVWRFEREDLITFRCRLRNFSGSPQFYNPGSFAVQAGRLTYYATVVDADGAVPAAEKDGAGHLVPGESVVYIGVYRGPGGRRNSLSPRQPFRVLVSTEQVAASLGPAGNSLDDIGREPRPEANRPDAIKVGTPAGKAVEIE